MAKTAKTQKQPRKAKADKNRKKTKQITSKSGLSPKTSNVREYMLCTAENDTSLKRPQKKQSKSRKKKSTKKQSEKQSAKEKERVVNAFDWPDEKGNLLAQHLRYEPKRFGWRRPNPGNPPNLENRADLNEPDDKKYWIYNLDDPKAARVKEIPYRVKEHLRALNDRPVTEPIFFVAGEHDYETCWDEGLFAVTFSGGENVWRKEYNAWFDPARPIMILTHNDEAGEKRGRIAASSLKAEKPDRIHKIILLPDLSEKGDITDWLNQGHNVKELNHIIENTIEFKARQTGRQLEESYHEKPCELLMGLCGDIELFHDEFGSGYGRVPVGNHHEVLSLSSKSFSLWLTGRYYSRHKDVPRKNNLNDTIAALEGKAQFDAPEKLVAVRIAKHDGKLYLDLGDHDWRAVEIDASGWRIINDSPVTFKRPGGLAALPEPVPGGSVDLLRPYVNIKDEENWILLIGWILGAFQPEGPYPILSITGEQGSAKSTVCRLIQDLIDPSRAKLRSLPRTDHDLMLAAINNRVLVFDNVSTISVWISDALCRLSTWSAFSTRKLYSNDEETILSKQCPIISNGIVEAANRSDLLDRMICLILKPIQDQDRLTERGLFEDFERDKPHILGAILDGVSNALRDFDNMKLPNPPRMADFACWVIAGLPGLGLSSGDFLKAYAFNRLATNQLALEGSILTEALQNFIASRLVWQGTASQLYEELNDSVPEKIRSHKVWPKMPNYLTRQLRRLAPNLRRIGIHIDFIRSPHKKRRRLIEIQFYPDDGVSLGKNGDDIKC